MAAVHALDGKLARLARCGGALRLALGRGVEALAARGGHHELGFSSIEAYGLERCERGARWVQESRVLARRLERLPRVAQALADGNVAWSAAGVVAVIATAETEARWLALARSVTVRELERAARKAKQASNPADGSAQAEDSETFRTLTVTVDHADGWLFEAALRVAEHAAGARDADTVVEALIAEAYTTLQPLLGRDGAASVPEDDPWQAAQRAWVKQLRQWREKAEEACEGRWRGATSEAAAQDGEGARRAGRAAYTVQPRFEGSAEAIDAELGRVARELLSRDLMMGKVAEMFWNADGWRRLGYATEGQYTRERLGQSLSSVNAKRALARRAKRLPALERSVELGSVGYEAARLIARVATEETEGEWIERAEQRTVKHLREEVNAVQMLASLEERPMTPPSEELMREVEELESRILSGAVFGKAGASEESGQSEEDGADGRGGSAGDGRDGRGGSAGDGRDGRGGSAGDGDGRGGSAGDGRDGRDAGRRDGTVDGDGEPISAGRGGSDRRAEGGGWNGQISARRGATRARPSLAGSRVTLKLRVREGTYGMYRWLERHFLRIFGRREPFLRFLCRALIETWMPTLGKKAAYGDVYARDRYRCRSPVCTRRDLTPHHLVFRAHGGDDSDENMLTLCVWCHLHGIHEGRLRAEYPARNTRFHMGRKGHTVVKGRRRERVAGVSRT